MDAQSDLDLGMSFKPFVTSWAVPEQFLWFGCTYYSAEANNVLRWYQCRGGCASLVWGEWFVSSVIHMKFKHFAL